MRKRRTGSVLLEHLEYFINVYMPVTRGLSRNTVISYKTTFTMLITFMCTVKGIAAEDITFQMLDQNTLSDFLSWLETERRCCVSTKNQQLAALYSFSEFAQNRDFEAASVFRSAVNRIPSKKTPKKRRVRIPEHCAEMLKKKPYFPQNK